MTHEEMIEWLACRVCGKPSGVDPDKCHATVGRQSPLCREHEFCRIKEKSEKQLSYAISPIDQNIFLKACPGSGKTEVVGLKAAHEIKKWSREIGGIAVLTFTNNAANVIHERVCQFAGIEKAGYPHFIGTIDSWLHKYIGHPFGHSAMRRSTEEDDKSIRLVSDNDGDGWLNAYKLPTAYTSFKRDAKGNVTIKDGKPVLLATPLYANMIRFDHEHEGWEIRVPATYANEYVTDSTYYDSEAFSAFRSDKPWLTLKYMRNGFKKIKSAFYAKGFATYQDIENICFEVLAGVHDLADKLAKRFPLVIIDECQDLSWIQLQILKAIMNAGSSLHFVGDLNQAIYQFKKVSPEKVDLFARDNGFTKMELTDNFRSCQGIVDTCKAIVPAEGGVRGMCQSKMESPCLLVTYKNDMISSLPDWFERFLKEKGLDVGKSAIVARGWSTVSRLRPSGNNSVNNYPTRLAMAIHLWRTGGIQAMGDVLKYMGRFIVEKWFPKHRSNSREHYCPDCVSSSMRWRLFLAQVLASSIKSQKIVNLDQAWSTWATGVRSDFGEIARASQPMLASSLTIAMRPFPDLGSHGFQAPRKKASETVTESLGSAPQQKGAIRIDTVHGVKGETMDAIMLVSASSKHTSDGHWTQWLADPSSEAARFAYVASSRPKHLLVWAIPEETNSDYSKLEALGFVPHKIAERVSP